jgi:hypothetical protein
MLTLLHFGLFFVLPLIRFELTRRLGVAAQGRHILIPAATAIAALIVWGLATVVPQRWQGPIFGIVIAGLIGWSGLHVYSLAEYASKPLPLRTVAQAAQWLPEPVNVEFGEGIELVSYDLDPLPAQGQLKLTLGWRSTSYVNERYLLRVLVIDQSGETVSQWVGYNGGGRLPTLAWDPGDSVFDRLTLPLPNLPAGKYLVEIQLLGQNGQPVAAKTETREEDWLSLGEFSLDGPARFLFPFGETTSFAIWGASGPVSNDKMAVRYPGTIAVITQNPATVELLGPGETRWQPQSDENNLHSFVVGPRWPTGNYQISINEEVSDLVLAVENWWSREYSPPEEIETPLPANFANQVWLLGYTLPQRQVKAGEAFPITLYWQAPSDKSPQANFIQFNNLLDSTGAQRGGYDRLPLEYYSTLLWAPGEVVLDGYAVPVDADAPPGEYYLDVGYYLTVGEAAVNLPLVEDGEMTDASSVTIGPIAVTAEDRNIND